MSEFMRMDAHGAANSNPFDFVLDGMNAKTVVRIANRDKERVVIVCTGFKVFSQRQFRLCVEITHPPFHNTILMLIIDYIIVAKQTKQIQLVIITKGLKNKRR